MLYIDTSILVAYYSPEALSDKIEKVLLNTQQPAISPLTEVELTSAIARKIREKSLAEKDGSAILFQFRQHLNQNSFVYLPIQSQHFTMASHMISAFNTPLRTLDAMHLAVAAQNLIPLLTADIKLAESAKTLGIDATLIA